MAEPRTLLVIAGEFPPLKTIGRIRTVKFVEHLRRFGWRCIVVTLQPSGREGNYDEALKHVEAARALEGKESTKLMMGQVLASMITARKASNDGADKSAYAAAFKAELEKRVSALPWDKVRESVLQARLHMVRGQSLRALAERAAAQRDGGSAARLREDAVAGTTSTYDDQATSEIGAKSAIGS